MGRRDRPRRPHRQRAGRTSGSSRSGSPRTTGSTFWPRRRRSAPTRRSASPWSATRSGAAQGGTGEIPQGHRRRIGEKEGRLRHRAPTRMPRRDSASGADRRSTPRTSAPPSRNWRRFTGKRSPHSSGMNIKRKQLMKKNTDQRQPVRRRNRNIQKDAGDRSRRQDEDDPR